MTSFSSPNLTQFFQWVLSSNSYYDKIGHHSPNISVSEAFSVNQINFPGPFYL